MAYFIDHFPSILVAFVALATYLRSHRNAQKIEDLHIQLNSRFDKFIKTVETEAFSLGVLHGKEETENKQGKKPETKES